MGLICGAIIVVIVCSFLPTLTYQPHGLFLPAKNATQYPPTDAQQVIITNFAPLHYQTLGTINIEQHLVANNLNEIKQITRYAQTLASQQGANAVIGQLFQSKPTGPEKGMSSYIFRGTAIRTT